MRDISQFEIEEKIDISRLELEHARTFTSSFSCTAVAACLVWVFVGGVHHVALAINWAVVVNAAVVVMVYQWCAAQVSGCQ